MTSALARAEIPADSASSVDRDLRCANHTLRELLGNSAEPIRLGHPTHQSREDTKDLSSSTTDQSADAYRIIMDLTKTYFLDAVLTLFLGFYIVIFIYPIPRISKSTAPPTVKDYLQTWREIAGSLGDLTSLTLPMMTLIIGLLSIPILTGDGRSASLEDRGRQLFLNGAIRIASFIVAILSLLTMINPPSTDHMFSINNIIPSAMIALFALLPQTLTTVVVDERRRTLHKAEEAIENINLLLPRGHINIRWIRTAMSLREN